MAKLASTRGVDRLRIAPMLCAKVGASMQAPVVGQGQHRPPTNSDQHPDTHARGRNKLSPDAAWPMGEILFETARRSAKL